MKNLKLLVFNITVITLFISCNQNKQTSSYVAEAYLKAIMNVDYREAKKYVVNDLVKSYEDGIKMIEEKDEKDLINSLPFLMKDATYKIIGEEEDNDAGTAKVTIQIFKEGSLFKDRIIHMISEDGIWKVDEKIEDIQVKYLVFEKGKGVSIDEINVVELEDEIVQEEWEWVFEEKKIIVDEEWEGEEIAVEKEWVYKKKGGKEEKEEFTIDGEGVYEKVEVMPEYPGGSRALLKFIDDNIVYPEIAKNNGIEGRVFMRFIVEKDGSVSNVKITRGIDIVLDKEAFRVVSLLPKFKPGKQNGKPVRVYFSVPVRFQL